MWQDCHSFPTRTLHQQIEPHVGQKKRLRPLFHSHHDCRCTLLHFSTCHSPLLLILIKGDVLFLMEGILSVGSHAARRGVVLTVIHVVYRVVPGVCFSIRILGSSVNFPHAQVGSLFTSSIADCVSFRGFIIENRLLSPHVLVGCVCCHD